MRLAFGIKSHKVDHFFIAFNYKWLLHYLNDLLKKEDSQALRVN